jgi:phage protein U
MALDYTTGAPAMMQLGGFQFGINTAAFQTLARSNEWRWPSQDRFGKPPVLQHVGQGSETITLPGVIYPEWRGGLEQLDAMRALAGKGEPLDMTDGRGNVMGKWAIEKVDEKQAVFASAGVPRKVEFTLQLRRFFETGDNMLASGGFSLGSLDKLASSFVEGGTVAIPADAANAVEQTGGLADSVASNAKSMAATAAKAYQDVSETIGPYAAQVKDAAGAALRVVDSAQGLQQAALLAGSSVTRNPLTAIALSSSQTLGSKASGYQVMASSSAKLLRDSTSKLEALGNVPEATVQSVRVAAACAEKTATLCRQTAGEAAKIIG